MARQSAADILMPGVMQFTLEAQDACRRLLPHLTSSERAHGMHVDAPTLNDLQQLKELSVRHGPWLQRLRGALMESSLQQLRQRQQQQQQMVQGAATARPPAGGMLPSNAPRLQLFGPLAAHRAASGSILHAAGLQQTQVPTHAGPQTLSHVAPADSLRAAPAGGMLPSSAPRLQLFGPPAALGAASGSHPYAAGLQQSRVATHAGPRMMSHAPADSLSDTDTDFTESSQVSQQHKLVMT